MKKIFLFTLILFIVSCQPDALKMSDLPYNRIMYFLQMPNQKISSIEIPLFLYGHFFEGDTTKVISIKGVNITPTSNRFIISFSTDFVYVESAHPYMRHGFAIGVGPYGHTGGAIYAAPGVSLGYSRREVNNSVNFSDGTYQLICTDNKNKTYTYNDADLFKGSMCHINTKTLMLRSGSVANLTIDMDPSIIYVAIKSLTADDSKSYKILKDKNITNFKAVTDIETQLKIKEMTDEPAKGQKKKKNNNK